MERPGIERLFVAVPVPDPVAAALCALRPEAAPGIAPIDPADMHITLHFLGNAQTGPVLAALTSIRQAAFSLSLQAPGSFRLRDGRLILWVGVRPSAALGELRDAVSGALAPLGFSAESRPFLPHITLARLQAGAAAGSMATLAAFARQDVPATAREFECNRFALYAGLAAVGAVRYRLVADYALAV